MWLIAVPLAYAAPVDPTAVRGALEAEFPGWAGRSDGTLGARLADLLMDEAALLEVVRNEVGWTASDGPSEVTLVVSRPEDPSRVLSVVEARRAAAEAERGMRARWRADGPNQYTKIVLRYRTRVRPFRTRARDEGLRVSYVSVQGDPPRHELWFASSGLLVVAFSEGFAATRTRLARMVGDAAQRAAVPAGT